MKYTYFVSYWVYENGYDTFHNTVKTIKYKLDCEKSIHKLEDGLKFLCHRGALLSIISFQFIREEPA